MTDEPTEAELEYGRGFDMAWEAGQLELARLRAENERLRSFQDVGLVSQLQAAKAENERLRAALEADPEAMARRFHDVYERLAPEFGYETRQETRLFDPTTPNGRLMIAVCAEILGRST